MDRLRQVIVESVLWLSSPSDFNDPFDMRCQVVFEGTGVEKRKALHSKFKAMHMKTSWRRRQRRVDDLMAHPQRTLAMIRRIFATNLEKAGVCCFATDPRHVLMWSHYGDHHKGIALQFEPSGDPEVFTRPARIKYSDNFPVINWINDTYEEISKVTKTKSKAWEYEDEWRITHPEGARTHQLFNPSALTGIVFGCRASKELKKKVSELLVEREKLGYPPIRLFQATMRSNEYSLVIHRLPAEHDS